MEVGTEGLIPSQEGKLRPRGCEPHARARLSPPPMDQGT